ncbi:methyl-accepting chemotaxis protein [Rhodobacter sp. KR11]|jgi:methyl-accepting chemotaxis protein|uniref:methyl-accepting chemotaxis protein n=1 Tax=Rhodobacter sp. KR11 TaxID=2974588 RepID=UPI002223C5B9|nr:methyl-accepting chemotaxis protein [Rhodobacter sp. KR11]MCW1918805.1 methyl-accepting chemotaxis protein [Rhodobacter sp. KR11]
MLSIQTRLLIVILLLGLTAIAGCLGMGYTAWAISLEKDKVLSASLNALNAANSLTQGLNDATDVVEGVANMTELVDIAKVRKEFTITTALIDTSVNAMKSAALSDQMEQSIADFETAKTRWVEQAKLLLGFTSATEIPTRELLQREAEGVLAQAIQIARIAQTDANAYVTKSRNDMRAQLLVTAALMLGAIVVVSGIVLFFSRRVARSVAQVAHRLRAMSGVGGPAKSRDEVAQMRQAAESLESELSAFQAALGRATMAAAAGDLTVRIEETASQEDLRGIAAQLNQVFAAVEGATGAISAVLRDYAAGNLSARMAGDYHGVFADLQRDGNSTGEKLTQLVIQIKETAQRIRVELQPIQNGARDLSSRATRQAERLHETAATMVELSATVDANAGNAARATQLSEGTSGAAVNGGSVANEAISAIRLVSENARQINEITGYVDDIAFQTNLLSLNAAVEAARAGDVGKGFAVVAHEVRMLANKAAEASSEIKNLIGQSTRNVGNGVKFVEATGRSLVEIHESVDQVVEAVGQISTAVKEQSAGINAVSDIVTSLEHETGLNARLASDSAAAVDGLMAEIGRLNKLIAYFTTEPATERQPMALSA